MMSIAKVAALRSTCSRLHVGAVIAQGAHPVSIGYNGAAAGEPHCEHTTDEPCSVSLHAESNALDFAYGPVSGGTMYITHAPCFQCAGRLINSQLARVIYGEMYRSIDGILRLQRRGIEVIKSGMV